MRQLPLLTTFATLALLLSSGLLAGQTLSGEARFDGGAPGSWAEGPISNTSFTEVKAKPTTDFSKTVTTGCTNYAFYQDIALNNFATVGYSVSAVPGQTWKGFDDFTFSATETIQTVILTVGDFGPNCSSPEFIITFYEDNGGVPGTELATRNVPAEAAIYTKEEIVAPLFEDIFFLFNLHIPITPVTLNAGTYWMEVHSPNQASFLDGVFWQTVNNGSFNGASAFNTLNGSKYVRNRDFAFAFCTGESTPVSACVSSNAPPEAICQNITRTADANCQGSAVAEDFDDDSSDPDDDPLIFSVSPEGPYALGTTTVTLTVSDGELTDECTATITVVDNTPPTALCQNTTVTLDENGMSSITAAAVNNGSSDGCGPVEVGFLVNEQVSQDLWDNHHNNYGHGQSFTAPQDGVLKTIRFYVNGASTGRNVHLYNSATGSGVLYGVGSPAYSETGVTLVDSQNGTVWTEVELSTPFPVMAGQQYAFVIEGAVDIYYAGDVYPGGVFIFGNDSAASGCCGFGDIAFQLVFESTVSSLAFDCGQTGANPATLVVTDEAGNQATCDLTITVEDVTPPTLDCAGLNTTLGTDEGECYRTVDFDDEELIPTFDDNCGVTLFEVRYRLNNENEDPGPWSGWTELDLEDP
ncbi:MAG: hypothetical protein KDC54_12235, partial [Lewinella sp.]|nr:hypothetical protein [Lewinella sp.]